MKLNKKVWWSKNGQVTQLLGSIEAHIQQKLEYFAHKGPNAFVNTGAADGYFPVGAIVSGSFERVYAFEIEHSGRDNVRENSILNNCEDVIKVFGEADYESINEVLRMEDTVVILIDIEGAECQFLDSKMQDLLKGHYVICELHPWLVEGGEKQQTKLLNRVKNALSVELIKREAYWPNHYEELNLLSDEERLVAIGEERAQNIQWLVLTPK